MVVYERGYLRLAEVFFDERVAETPADIVRYQFRPEPVAGCRSFDFHTLVCNLGEEPDTLMGRIHKQTRYEIRRAEKDNLTYEAAARPAPHIVTEFLDFYDQFAQSKHLKLANRSRISAFAAHEALDLSRMRSPEGEILVWHAYIRTSNRARLLHSASLFRAVDKQQAAMISRANRLQHWLDIQRFRSEGLAIYDFGGWYPGETDTEKLRINQFKESFGGELVHQYNADRPVTWKGMAVLRLRGAVEALSGRKS
jgi:hypothetical protein